jgi:hypothetical protein
VCLWCIGCVSISAIRSLTNMMISGKLIRMIVATNGAWSSVVVEALRYSRSVPESVPSGATGFFIDISPSNLSMTLGSSQLLVKMSTRNIPGSKGGR